MKPSKIENTDIFICTFERLHSSPWTRQPSTFLKKTSHESISKNSAIDFFYSFFTSTSKIIAASPPFPPTLDTPIHCASDLLFAQLSGTLLLGTSDFSLNAPFFSGRVCYTDTNRWRETNIRRLTKHRFYARATCCKAITFVQGITGEAR